jgi:uncharacterized membrane protein
MPTRTLLVSWPLVHTAFALQYDGSFYAPSYPRGDGSLKLPRGHLPVYMGFLNFSLVVGMT